MIVLYTVNGKLTDKLKCKEDAASVPGFLPPSQQAWLLKLYFLMEKVNNFLTQSKKTLKLF